MIITSKGRGFINQGSTLAKTTVVFCFWLSGCDPTRQALTSDWKPEVRETVQAGS